MRRIAIAGLHLAVISAGLMIAFWPTITSGFALLQTDPGDTLLNHYILEHTWKCLSDPSYPGTLWSPPCFFPEQGTFAYSENMLGAAPIYWLARIRLAEVPAYQVWMLSVATLTYVSVAWTLHQFGVSHLLAALGGVVFAFGMPRINQLGHQQLLPLYFSPPAVYFVWRFLESPRVWWLACLLSCVVVQIAASIYLGWFLVFGLTVFVGLYLIFEPDARHRIVAFVGANQWPASACVGISTLALLALLLPYWHANRGFHRHYGEVSLMLPTLRSWVSPGWGSAWRNWLPAYDGPMAHEHHNFTGVVFILLLSWTLWMVFARQWSWLGIFTLRPEEMGPRAKVEANDDSPHPALGPLSPLAGPAGEEKELRLGVFALVAALLLVLLSLKLGNFSFWRVIYMIVPGAKAIRAVARIYSVVYLFAWIGALIWADRQLRKWGRAGLVLSLAFLILGAVEQIHPTLPVLNPRSFFAEVDRLAGELRGGTAAYVEPDQEAPFWTSQIAAMWAGLKANVPVVNGYSGRAPKGYPDMRQAMSVAEVAAWTRRADIRYIGPVRLAQDYPAPPVVAGIDHRPFRADAQASRWD